MSDPRKTRHWHLRDLLEPPPTDDTPTQVPCFTCDGSGTRDGHPCADCSGSGLVAPEVRQSQREVAGNPPSTEQCDRERKR